MSSEKVNLNILGQVTDTTWTRSGASSGPAPSRSIKTTIQTASEDGDLLIKVVYATVANLETTKELRVHKLRLEEEGDAYIKAAVAKYANDYKELTSETIKFKVVNTTTHMDIIDYNSMTGKRSALFRRISIFTV